MLDFPFGGGLGDSLKRGLSLGGAAWGFLEGGRLLPEEGGLFSQEGRLSLPGGRSLYLPFGRGGLETSDGWSIVPPILSFAKERMRGTRGREKSAGARLRLGVS